jgi:hypothetical protein
MTFRKRSENVKGGLAASRRQRSYHPFTFTGPERDLLFSETDEWPAFTAAGAPLGGPGVNRDLLGSVDRPGIGRQVTYGGHLLYLYDRARSATGSSAQAAASSRSSTRIALQGGPARSTGPTESACGANRRPSPS